MRIPLELETGGAQQQMSNFANTAAQNLNAKLSGAVDKAGQLAGAFGTIGKTLDKFPSTFGETGKEMQKVAGLVEDAASQAKDWAAAGAVIGSVIPGVGTAIGGLVGTAASVGLSIWDWASGASETEKKVKNIEAIQKRIHEEEGTAALARWKAIQRENKEKRESFDKDSIAEMLAAGSAAAKAVEENDKKKADAGKAAYDKEQAAHEAFAKWFEKFQADMRQKDLDAQQKYIDEAVKKNEERIKRDQEAQEVLAKESSKAWDAFTKKNQDDAKAYEKWQKEQHDKSVKLYQGYAMQVTAVTGELTAQLEQNIAAGDKLFMGFGAAAEKGVSQVLKALAKEYTVKATGEVAEGFASLGKKDVEGAVSHFISAAKFGLAATAAGVGGAATGGDATRRSTAREAESAGGGGLSSPSDSRISDPGTTDLRPIVINFNSTVPADERGAQEQAAVIEGILRKGQRR